MSGVSIAEREYYFLLLDLDDLDPTGALARAVRQLLTVARATEAFVEIQPSGALQPTISERFTFEVYSKSSLPPHEGVAELESVRMSTTARVHVRLLRAPGSRDFTVRQRDHLDRFTRTLLRVADRVVRPDLSDGLHEQRRRFEDWLIAAALDQSEGNVAEAARMLGVARSFIYSRREAPGHE